MIKKGAYKINVGNEVIVAQIKPPGTEAWVARGAIKGPDGVLYAHVWDLNGKSISIPDGTCDIQLDNVGDL